MYLIILKNLLLILFGVFIGYLIGIFPGFHPNSFLKFFIENYSLYFDKISLSIAIITVAITYSFSSFLSAILFNVPDEYTFLSIDPMRKLALKGKGYKALILSLYGGLLSVAFSIPFIIFLFLFGKTIYGILIDFLPYVLILVSFMLIYRENNKIKAAIIYLLSGILGYFTLNLNIPSVTKLSALLTGLYGFPYILLSIFSKEYKIKKQIFDFELKERLILSSLIGTLAAFLIIFFPALTPVIALIPFLIIFRLSIEELIIALGALSTADILFSFIALLSFGNPRSGSAVYLEKYGITDSLLFFATVFISLFLLFILSPYVFRFIIDIFEKLGNKIKIISIFVLIFLLYIFRNPLSLLILITATSLSFISLYLNVSRVILISCLIFPLLINFLL